MVVNEPPAQSARKQSECKQRVRRVVEMQDARPRHPEGETLGPLDHLDAGACQQLLEAERRGLPGIEPV